MPRSWVFFVIVISSTLNVPNWGSSKPNMISTIVVLPLPVAPTNPTLDFAEIFKLKLLIDGLDVLG